MAKIIPVIVRNNKNTLSSNRAISKNPYPKIQTK
jgi:hypothetical protein